mmetsp:Transcript_30056/g.40705  ORF Transcript_30056/g.40705 Transcript_30056/m.40705 type:complete len:246 (-) Transcript_30056:22-759(-)
MELIKQLFLFLFEVLELLKTNFVMPFGFLADLLLLSDIDLELLKLTLDLFMNNLLLFLLLDFFCSPVKRFNNSIVHLLLMLFVFSSLSVLLVGVSDILLQLANDIHICVANIEVVLTDLFVLIFDLVTELLDSHVLLSFNFQNLSFALLFHVFTQELHFEFVLLLDLFRNALEFIADRSHFLVLIFSQGVQVLLLSHFLLLLLDFKRSQILLKFTLIDTMLVFSIFQSNLSILLELSQLIQILEH